MIFGPGGQPIAKAIPEDQEGILYADIDLSLIAIAKAAYDPSGHYSRGDVGRLMINRSPRKTSMNFSQGMSEAGALADSPAK